MKITVFCSANEHIDPEYFRLTEELGKWMAENHHDLIFGGTNQGLMNCVAKAVHEGGGRVIGVVPSLVEKGGRMSDYLDVHIPTDNLSDRKNLLINQCDVVVALPGGVGSLDEIFCVAASKCIGYHSKKVILYNMKGFWNALIALMDDLDKKGMIRGEAAASCTHDGKKSILSAHGGTVVNAVPASAYAMLAGFTADEVNAAIADAPEGVSFIYEDGKLTAQGKSAHASTPWEGVNALTALMKVLGRLKTDDETAALFANAASAFPFGETNGKALSLDISDERSGPLTLVFSIMDYEGGKLCGKFDIRFPICLNVPRVRELLEEGLAKHSLVLASMTGTEPHYVDENSDFIRTLLRVYEEQTGLEGKTIAIGGGTYVHNTSGGVAFGGVRPSQ